MPQKEQKSATSGHSGLLVRKGKFQPKKKWVASILKSVNDWFIIIHSAPG